MSLAKKIAHNTALQITGKVISTILGLVAVAMMTRYLGPTGFGHYTTIIAFLQFFGIVVDMGLSLVVIQMTAEDEKNQQKIASNIFTLRLISAAVILGSAPLLALLFPYPAVVKTGIALTTLSFFFISLNQIIIGLFQKQLKMLTVAVAEVISRVVLVAGIAAVMFYDAGFLPVMSVIVVGSLVNFFITFVKIKKSFHLHLSWDKTVWVEALRRSWPIAISIVFNLLYFKADTVILSLYRPAAEVGIYGATYKVLEVLTQITYLFMGLILPIYSATWASKNLASFKDAIQKAFDATAIIAMPMVAGLFLLGTPVMMLVAGSEFADAGPLLQILIFATGAIFFTNVFTYAIVAAKLQKTMLWGFVAAAVIGLAGYFVLIPLYSYWGAAIMTLVVESFVSCYAMWVIYQAVGYRPRLKIFFKAVAAALIMAAAVWFVEPIMPLLLTIAVGAVVYPTVLYLLNGYDKKLLKEILSRP